MDFFNFAEQVIPPAPRKLEVIYTGGFAESMSPDDLIETRLTKYLEYETWTPEQGAYLINGIDAVTVNHPHYCGKIASLADGEIIQNPQYHLDWANVVLTKWNKQENPPAKVRPIAFIEWCRSQGIDTGWVTNADEWADYVQRQRPAISDHEKMFEEIERRHWEQYETDPEYRAKYVAEQVKRNSEREQEEAEEIKARIESGRYTFKEAAKLIANNSRSTSDSIYSKLEQAALDGKLTYYAPNKDEVYKRVPIKNWYELLWSDLNKWLDDNEQLIVYRFPEPEASAQSERPSSKKIEVDPIFAQFPNLHARDISFQIGKDFANVVIRKKTFKISPKNLGLKFGKQGWNLLEKAAMSDGNFEGALKSINNTTNRENERNNAKTAISRLREKLVNSMGLHDDPILEDRGSYRLIFNSVSYNWASNGRATKGDDALAHRDHKAFNENKYVDHNDFYGDDFDPADMGNNF